MTEQYDLSDCDRTLCEHLDYSDDDVMYLMAIRHI